MCDDMKKKTEDLIHSLSGELEVINTLPHPIARALPWFLAALIYLTITTIYMGPRADIYLRIYDPLYILEIIILTFISASAAFSALWLTVPDVRGAKWMPYIPIGGFVFFILWQSISCIGGGHYLPEVDIFHICYKQAIIFGLIPALSLLFVSSKGNTTSPYMMSFMNVLSVGPLGYIGLRISCISDEIGHLCVYHFLPYFLIGLLIVAIGKRLYRW